MNNDNLFSLAFALEQSANITRTLAAQLMDATAGRAVAEHQKACPAKQTATPTNKRRTRGRPRKTTTTNSVDNTQN